MLKRFHKIIGKVSMIALFGITFLTLINSAHARIVFKNEFTIDDDGANTFILDAGDDVTGNVSLQFGNSLAETITFDTSNTWFDFSDDINLNGEEDTERIRFTDTTNADSVGFYTGLGDPDGALSGEAGSLFLSQDGDAYVNRSTGSGTNWGRLIATGAPSKFAQTVEVAKSGAEFTSVKAALDSITDSSTTKRYAVHVYPGIYTEDPMTMPDYVSIIGMGYFGNISIVASTTGSILITSGERSLIRNIKLSNATGSSCFYTSKASFIINTEFDNCQTGIYVTGSSADLHLNSSLIHGGTFTDVVKVDGGAKANLQNFHVSHHDGTTITNGINVSGAGTVAKLNSAGITPASATNGVYVNDSAQVYLTNVGVANATNALHVGPTGTSSLHGSSGTIMNASTYDLYVESGSATVHLDGWEMQKKNFNIHEDASLILTFLDDTPGDESFSIFGELHVGTPEHPYESTFGEGDSYTNGMLVYTYNGFTYTDVSTAAQSFSGSTFALPGTTVNNAIYISSDRKDSSGNYVQFEGQKVEMGGTALNVGSGELVHEYWNGSSWVEFETMCTNADLFYRYSKYCYYRPSTSEQVRYSPEINGNWVANDPPTTGTNRYWVRIRVKTAITTAPVFEQFRIHSNNTEINSDGTLTFHGDARKNRTFIFSPENLFFGKGSSLPDNYAFNVGSGAVSWTDERSLAAFTGIGSSQEELTGSIALPKGIDTSNGLIIKIYWMKKTSGTGNVKWKIDHLVDAVQNVKAIDGSNEATAPRTTGDAIDVTSGSTITTVATGSSTAASVPILSQFEKIDISDFYEGDTLFVRLYRDAGDAEDTYVNDAIMLGFEVSGTFWTIGDDS